MAFLGPATRDYRFGLMREMMDREGYDALAFTQADFFQFVTNFHTDVQTWERPILCVVPRNGEAFAILNELSTNHWRFAREAQHLWVTEAHFYAEHPRLGARVPLATQWAELVADKLSCGIDAAAQKVLEEAGVADLILHRTGHGTEAFSEQGVRGSRCADEAISRNEMDRIIDPIGMEGEMDLQLKGLRAVVSGGTKGIGRAMAETLASEGADVAICARNGEEVKATAAALAKKGVRSLGHVVDVGDGKALKGWVEAVAAAFGGIDIVIANVSALAIGGDEEGWRRGFEVDLMHSVRLVNAAMPWLEKSRAGSIVTISSVSGREIDFAAGPYGAFKAALIHYTQGLAYQLAGKGIRANTVSPGNTYFEGGVWNKIKDGNPDLYQTALGLNPTGRMGTPQEMANAAVFLASPVASFITGTNLVVDGALTRGVQF